jgi:hypothetical protein
MAAEQTKPAVESAESLIGGGLKDRAAEANKPAAKPGPTPGEKPAEGTTQSADGDEDCRHSFRVKMQ